MQALFFLFFCFSLSDVCCGVLVCLFSASYSNLSLSFFSFLCSARLSVNFTVLISFSFVSVKIATRAQYSWQFTVCIPLSSPTIPLFDGVLFDEDTHTNPLINPTSRHCTGEPSRNKMSFSGQRRLIEQTEAEMQLRGRITPLSPL